MINSRSGPRAEGPAVESPRRINAAVPSCPENVSLPVRFRDSSAAPDTHPSIRSRAATLLRLAAIAGGVLMASPKAAPAHEIPREVTVRAFVQPKGDVLRIAVRVPLEAMRDVEFALRGPGYLDVARSDALMRDAAKIWVADGLTVFADGTPLGAAHITAVRASLPSDGAFLTLDAAVQHLASAPLDADVNVPWQQAMLDVLLEYRITSDSADFAIRPNMARLGVRTMSVVQFVPPNGTPRVYTYEGDPGLLTLDPGFLDAALRFVQLGVTHILGGIDHLLFLLCLVVPFRKIRPLVAIVTSFTVAHSLSLGAAAFGFAPDALWFPPLVEMLIALSIVYMACENILGVGLERRWTLAFAFGLVHGFGFSFALRDSLQFAGAQLVTSLAAFNVGVELGQVAVLLVAVPVLVMLFRRVPERAGVILLSAFVAHTAWHWTTERGEALAQHRIALPVMDALFAANAIRALIALVLVAGTGWLLHRVLRRWVTRHAAASPAVAAPAAASLAPLVLLASAALCGAALMGTPVRAEAQTSAAKPGGLTTMSGVYTAEQAKQGREVFTGTCTGCHTPAAHTGPVFTTKWVGRSVDDLFTYIRNSMPKIAPGSLTEDEYVWVTAYILRLNGMPPGTTELSAEPALMRAVKIDTVKKK